MSPRFMQRCCLRVSFPRGPFQECPPRSKQCRRTEHQRSYIRMPPTNVLPEREHLSFKCFTDMCPFSLVESAFSLQLHLRDLTIAGSAMLYTKTLSSGHVA